MLNSVNLPRATAGFVLGSNPDTGSLTVLLWGKQQQQQQQPQQQADGGGGGQLQLAIGMLSSACVASTALRSVQNKAIAAVLAQLAQGTKRREHPRALGAACSKLKSEATATATSTSKGATAAAAAATST